MRVVPALTLTALVGLTATPAWAKALEEDDFAYGSDVYVDSGTPVQTLMVPVELYRGVIRTDLGDVRVFNHDGEQVPHAIRSLGRETTEVTHPVSLAIFPLRGGPQTRVEDLVLHLRRSNAGALIALDMGGSTDNAAGVRAYILDASEVPRALRRLNLQWAARDTAFLARVTVEGSDDLTAWTTLESNASIARLDYRGHVLERKSINLPSTQSKYLRLRWSGVEAPFELIRVEADLVSQTLEPQRQTLPITGNADSTKPGMVYFDLGGPIPVDRIEIGLPQQNTLVQAELQSSASAKGPWARRFGGELYRVTYDGEELTNLPIRTAPNADRYWRLVVEQKGGGLGKGLPVLNAGWLPQQLLFVTRGKGPFVLAYGSHAAESTSFDAGSLVDLVPGQSVEALEQQTATMGAARELGGAKALVPPVPPTPWKLWLLWAALVFGVLLLAWMTVRLVRQLNAAGDGEGGQSGAG